MTLLSRNLTQELCLTLWYPWIKFRQWIRRGLIRVTRENTPPFLFFSFSFAVAHEGLLHTRHSHRPHSYPHTLALFNTGLHSLNPKLNPVSGLLGMTDTVNIVKSVCQDTGRPGLPWQEAHSQNIVQGWKMRPGKRFDSRAQC